MSNLAYLRHARNTSVYNGELGTAVQYVNTHVFTLYNDGSIRLNSGGYRTPTTKRRINQAADAFGINLSVWQKDFDWYVKYNGKTYDFVDRMRFYPDGGVGYDTDAWSIQMEDGSQYSTTQPR